jgi:tRNA A37 threonylcarbamoyltransferase TsaD
VLLDDGPVILGIETSCDETAAALVTSDGHILANVVSSQADLHARFGGVVPEIASRRHLELLLPVLREALGEARATLDDVEAIGVTVGPGLIGALLVGTAGAKALAWARRLPIVPVDHLHGHVASLYLQPEPLEPPFLCLLASGGHTLLLDVRDEGGYELIGTTLDDAAGEAFDKGARLLGLGYPGGAEIDRLSGEGDPDAFSFPVARLATASPSRASRQRSSTPCETSVPRSSSGAVPIWQPATSARSCAHWSSGRSRRPIRSAPSGSPSWAVSLQTPSFARRCRTRLQRRFRCARTTPP